MSVIDEVVSFVRARLDEREADATAAAGEVGPDWYYDTGLGFVASRQEQDLVATGSQDHLGRERGAHIARHDPASVLRDVAARRRIVDNYAKVCGYGHGGYTTRDEAYVLAAVYDDHPDYQEAWRP